MDSSVELLTLAPFIGAGPLLRSECCPGPPPPASFPVARCRRIPVSSMPTTSCRSTSPSARRLRDPPRRHSAVLYAVQRLRPQHRRDDRGQRDRLRVGSGEVIGPVVPEPSTLILIGMGLGRVGRASGASRKPARSQRKKRKPGRPLASRSFYSSAFAPRFRSGHIGTWQPVRLPSNGPLGYPPPSLRDETCDLTM